LVDRALGGPRNLTVSPLPEREETSIEVGVIIYPSRDQTPFPAAKASQAMTMWKDI
jgi:hypothetical protein